MNLNNSVKNKSVLVVGGAGFIGSHIVDRAMELGAEKVMSFDNFSGVISDNLAHLKGDPRFVSVKGDLRNFEEVKKAIEGVDLILNQATSKLVTSIKDPMADVMTNTVGNMNLLEAMRKSGSSARIVHASTGSVFGDAQVPYNDTTSVKEPTTIYGANKLAAEHYHLYFAKEYGIKSSIVRYYHVYGERQDSRLGAGVINLFLSNALAGKAPQVCGKGEAIRCFTYVKDCAEANFLVANSNYTIAKRYNVASKVRMSVLELAEMIAQKYGAPGMKPTFIPERTGEVLRPIPDTRGIEELGFKESVTFDEGLERTKQWIAGQLQKQ
ncbi:MAG: GDP-mannose 4,6-dehydratase [Nanoarchaeota archaeon]|nr:GDP-mannose 4,6-dehydratase [Nanoarchaeota archaeon]